MEIKAINPIWNHETGHLVPVGDVTEFYDAEAAQSLVASGDAEVLKPEAKSEAELVPSLPVTEKEQVPAFEAEDE